MDNVVSHVFVIGVQSQYGVTSVLRNYILKVNM